MLVLGLVWLKRCKAKELIEHVKDKCRLGSVFFKAAIGNCPGDLSVEQFI